HDNRSAGVKGILFENNFYQKPSIFFTIKSTVSKNLNTNYKDHPNWPINYQQKKNTIRLQIQTVFTSIY
uniref:hypothetical protein n=1 Tax=Salmonella enterica TaxID=28901 RepID=UPI0020C54E4A